MEKKMKITIPRYQQIATDIATKIVEKHYKIGDKVYARSALASQYGVSPETARRAISILSDLEIVETTKGSGIVIKSYEKAYKFISQYKDIQTVNDLKKEILECVDRQAKEIDYLNTCLVSLIEKTDRFRSVNPFAPFEIEITNEMLFVDKTVSEVNFWHHTSATIIAIKREEELLMSPGPYAVFRVNDRFYFVGDENCLERVKSFLYGN